MIDNKNQLPANSTELAPVPTAIILWIIWGVILSGLFVIQFFIAGGFPSGKGKGEVPYLFLLLCLLSAVISTLVRWLVLPRMKTVEQLLPVMIVGLSLAEACGIVGIFLIGESAPTAQLLTFGIAVLCIIQYIPVYASKFNDGAKGNPSPGKL